MIFIKINSKDSNILPENIYDYTDFDNPVLLEAAQFKYYYLLQNKNTNPDIIAAVSDGVAFHYWYESLSPEIKSKITVLSEETVYILSDYLIQICQPSNPAKTNKTILEEYLNILQNES